jgi:hypothetical protein
MSVLSCTPKVGSRRGPVKRSDGGRTWYNTYIVRTSKATDTGELVLTANGLPKFGDAYSGDPLARVTELDPRLVEDQKTVWEVTVAWTYSPRQNQGLMPDDIERMPPRRSWSSITEDIYPTTDLDGQPYVNSAGDPFDPPPRRTSRHSVLTIEAARLDWDEQLASRYRDAVNLDTIVVDRKRYQKFSAKINQIDGQQEYLRTGTPYWRVTIVIEFNPDLWYPTKVLDRGPRRFEFLPDELGGDGEKILVLNRDDNGVLTGRDILLDGKGFMLDVAVPPKWMEFRDYNLLPFRPLNLPLSP